MLICNLFLNKCIIERGLLMKKMRILLCLLLAVSMLSTSIVYAKPKKGEAQSVKITQNDKNVRMCEGIDDDEKKINAVFNKSTGKLTITKNGEEIYNSDTAKKFEKQVEKKQLPSVTSKEGKENTISSSSWTRVSTNMDMYYGFYYARWKNGTTYS